MALNIFIVDINLYNVNIGINVVDTLMNTS